MVHGYYSSSVNYFLVLKKLSTKYRIVLLDQLGFGASSRVDFPFTLLRNVDACDEFAVEWVEKWTKKMTEKKKLPEKFYLTAHSYGGYIMGMWASNNQDRVIKLLLNSPFGCEPRPEDEDEFMEALKKFRDFNGDPNYLTEE